MSNPVRLEVRCYKWYQFLVMGRKVESEDPGYYTWDYPEYMEEWLHRMMRGEWTIMQPARRIPLFISDGCDAMLFKLTWDGSL